MFKTSLHMEVIFVIAYMLRLAICIDYTQLYDRINFGVVLFYHQSL